MVLKKIMGIPIITKKIRILNHACILLVVVLFSACYQIKPIQIEVVKPAKIEIPATISKALVLNAAVPKYSTPITNKSQASFYQLDSTVTQKLTLGVSKLLKESPRFTNVVLHKKLYHKPQNYLPARIDWSVLEQLCYQNNTESVIALEAIKISDTTLVYSSLTENGYVYDQSVMLLCNSLWRIYNTEDKKMVRQWLQHDTVYMNEFYSSMQYRSRIKRQEVRSWIAEILTNEIAHKVSNAIAPYWTTVKRDVFLSLNQEMQLAAILVSENKWKQAASIWKKYTDNSDVKLAGKACHNMALVCEVEGRLDIALIWLNKAIDKYPNFITENYKSVIEYRLNEEELLNKQFGN